jgi:DNA polymerase (family 10)
MLSIKGIGPKKIRTIWKEMEIESLGELLYACKENRLKLYKGFGEKTQQQVIDNIEFFQKNQGKFLFAQAESLLPVFTDWLNDAFPNHPFLITGQYIQQLEIIDYLTWVTTANVALVQEVLEATSGYDLKEKKDHFSVWSTPVGPDWIIHNTDSNSITEKVIELSCDEQVWNRIKPNSTIQALDEKSWFELNKIPHIPAFVRDNIVHAEKFLSNDQPTYITPENIHGIIHCHSMWSDGKNTLKEMALEAIERKLDYMVISDHSQSAFYASGLTPERVKAQHKEIDQLNFELAPFKIFKSIESDILGDGSLDYTQEILHQFDLVIASIHSNLKMTEEKAMTRLLNAIQNPFTTILGHPTGRLLLSRNGYPVNHDQLIDACVKHNVVIEINAHPSRLDLDWRFISQAVQKNALLSINPDAHQLEGFDDTRYGVFVAQKAMLKPEKNLSSFKLDAIESFIETQKTKRR